MVQCNFDQSTSSGSFATGTGAVTINGSTNVVAAKTLTVAGANALILGTPSSKTGGVVFQGSGGAGTLTVAGPTTQTPVTSP